MKKKGVEMIRGGMVIFKRGCCIWEVVGEVGI